MFKEGDESGEAKVANILAICVPEIDKMSDFANPYRQKLKEKLERWARAVSTSKDEDAAAVAYDEVRRYIEESILMYDKYDPDRTICRQLLYVINNPELF